MSGGLKNYFNYPPQELFFRKLDKAGGPCELALFGRLQEGMALLEASVRNH